MKEAPATGKSSSKSKRKEHVFYDDASALQLTNSSHHRSPIDATENVGATQSEAQAKNHSNTSSISGSPQVEPVSDQTAQNLSVKVNYIVFGFLQLDLQNNLSPFPLQLSHAIHPKTFFFALSCML